MEWQVRIVGEIQHAATFGSPVIQIARVRNGR
jgi:hypothetical protein